MLILYTRDVVVVNPEEQMRQMYRMRHKIGLRSDQPNPFLALLFSSDIIFDLCSQIPMKNIEHSLIPTSPE